MKLFTKFFALLLIAVCSFTVIACNNNGDDGKKDYENWCFEFDVDTDDDGLSFATITGLYVPDTMLTDYSNGLIKALDLVVGTEKEGKVGLKAQKDDDKVDSSKYKNVSYADGYYYGFDYLKIGDDAFANQTIIGTVTVAESVKEIGVASFAGCSSITKMELPFVGNQAKDALNAKKVFANIFGTSEATGCTSTTVYYNSSASTAFYIPDGLKEIVINYTDKTHMDAEGKIENPNHTEALPVCAFNALANVTKITVNGNIKTIGQSAFASCSALIEVNLPATIETIGSKAFSGCSSLVTLDLAKLTALKAIYQEAFSGCAKLGLGYETVTLTAGVKLYDKAFASCVSIKALDLTGIDVIPEGCFLGCTALEKVTLDGGAVLMNNAFVNCTALKKENVVNYNETYKNAFDWFNV